MPEEINNNETQLPEEIKRQQLIDLLTDKDLAVADGVFYLGYLEGMERAAGIKNSEEKPETEREIMLKKNVQVEDLRDQGRMASLAEIESLIDDSEGASDEYLEYVVEKMAKARMEKLKQNRPARMVLKLIPESKVKQVEKKYLSKL